MCASNKRTRPAILQPSKRRRNSASSISLAPISRKLELNGVIEDNTPAVRRPYKTPDSMTERPILGASWIDSALANHTVEAPAAAIDSQVAANASEANVPDGPSYPLGWLARSSTPRSESTVTDELWRD